MKTSVIHKLISQVDAAVSKGASAGVYQACGVLIDQLNKIEVDDIADELSVPYLNALRIVSQWSKDIRGANLSAWPELAKNIREAIDSLPTPDVPQSDESKLSKFWSEKRYEILNRNMGSGAFGRAVLVRDNDINMLQIAKVYDPAGMTAEDRARFYRFFKSEIGILHSLYHRNIVRIFSAHLYERQQSGIILMEYVKGRILDKYVADYNAEEDDVNSVFYQLIDAFAYLESKNVLHRDVRPSNIMVDEDGVVKVIDFGLGKVKRKCDSVANSIASVVNHEDVRVTPAEEMDGEYESVTDMYYLGEMLQRLIKGSKCESQFRYGDVVSKMCEYSKLSRFGSFRDIVNAINQNKPWTDATDDDRDVYLAFVKPLVNGLNFRYAESAIVVSDEKLLAGLVKVIEENSFEYYVSDISSLISVFVHGAYNYKKNERVPVSAVKGFYLWFRQSNENKRRIILSSIRSRLESVKVAQSKGELPF